MDTIAPLERDTFATSDQSHARAVLNDVYGSDVRVSTVPTARWRMSLSRVEASAAGFCIADMTLPVDLTFHIRGRDNVVIDTVVDGQLGMERGGSSSRYRRGDVFVATQPGIDWVGTARQVQLQAVTLSDALLVETAGTPDSLSPQLFDHPEPQPDGVVAWRRAVRYVQMVAEQDALLAPLVVGSAGRLLAATALSLFPNAAVGPPTSRDRRDGHPDTVRRAVAYIEAHPDLDMGVADIARAAYVTPRAVQVAFRRHLDTTPMAYLRRVRLSRAHEELSSATRGDTTTVTATAARWGFTSARFSAQYKAVFGELPSRTLRS